MNALVTGLAGPVYNVVGGSRVMRDTCADTTRARADSGWMPAVSIEEGPAAGFAGAESGADAPVTECSCS